MNTTNKLLSLLIRIVIDTHNYEPMEAFREELKQIEKDCDK